MDAPPEYYRTSLDHGVLSLYVPSILSEDDLEDIRGLFNLFMRRAERNVIKSVAPESPGGEDSDQ